jgi:hypothetical protein
MSNKILRSQAGQVSVEYIMITVVLVGLALSVKKFIISENMLGNFVQKPWDMVAGMIETGVWGEPNKVRPMHPGHIARHNSLAGEGHHE